MAPSSYDGAVDSYLRDCRRRGLRPATIRYYDMVLRRLGGDCGLAAPGDLTLARVRRFQDEPGRLSARSVSGFLRAAKTFSRWLADEEVLTTDPLGRLRLPRMDEWVVVAPTDRELVDLPWEAAPPLRLVIALLMGTGIRISDLALLSRGSLRPGELVLSRTKGRAGRLVPLDPVLEALVLRHADGDSGGRDAPLVTSRTGRRLTPDAARRVLADARTRAALTSA